MPMMAGSRRQAAACRGGRLGMGEGMAWAGLARVTRRHIWLLSSSALPPSSPPHSSCVPPSASVLLLRTEWCILRSRITSLVLPV